MSATEQPASPEQLLREGRALRALARRLLDDEAGADDVVQEAVTAAWQQGVDARLSRRWLAGVTRRLALARRRGEHRRRRREAVAAVGEVSGSAADAAATSEVARRVAAAVERLEEPFRSAVVLRFWQGLPPRAIARQLDVPVATVHSRIRRGMERLRHRLDDGPRGRAGWALPLAGLAWPPVPVVAATSSGVLIMGFVGKAIALLLALVAGLSAWMLWSDSAPPTVPDETWGAAANRQPLDSETGVGGDASTGAPDAAEERRVARSVDSAVAPRLVVVGRLVDEATDTAVSTGFVDFVAEAGADRVRARCGTDGRFRLELEDLDERSVVAFWSEAPGYARERHTLARDDAVGDPPTVDLGEIGVAPGTRLSGFVVDDDGAPLPGAKVFFSGPTFSGGIRSMARGC